MVEQIISKFLENGVVALIALGLLYWILRIQSQLIREGFRHLRSEAAMQTASTTALISTLQGFQQTSLLHHATVFGVNPSLGETQDERTAFAVKQFSDMIKILDEQKDQVSKSMNLIDLHLERLLTTEDMDTDFLMRIKNVLSANK